LKRKAIVGFSQATVVLLGRPTALREIVERARSAIASQAIRYALNILARSVIGASGSVGQCALNRIGLHPALGLGVIAKAEVHIKKNRGN